MKFWFPMKVPISQQLLLIMVCCFHCWKVIRSCRCSWIKNFLGTVFKLLWQLQTEANCRFCMSRFKPWYFFLLHIKWNLCIFFTVSEQRFYRVNRKMLTPKSVGSIFYLYLTIMQSANLLRHALYQKSKDRQTYRHKQANKIQI